MVAITVGITFPSGERQAQLLKEVYEEAGVDPAEVKFIETHGTGTKVGDPLEANSITQIFCENRTEPLLIGSTKSNLGHCEPASGLASVAKVQNKFPCSGEFQYNYVLKRYLLGRKLE